MAVSEMHALSTPFAPVSVVGPCFSPGVHILDGGDSLHSHSAYSALCTGPSLSEVLGVEKWGVCKGDERKNQLFPGKGLLGILF